MRWQSPWGEGFPGWHIECSAMSMKYLGETFDIHGGGLDNQFPHHECEIAQSECATGKPFVKYWIHNNLVTVNGQKMSKSLGNFVTLKDIFKKFDPAVIRFFILQSHYRSTLDFSEQALEASKTGLAKLQNTVRRLHEAIDFAERSSSFGPFERDLTPFWNEFIDAMNDDFNTPKAIAVLFDLASKVNEWLMPGMLPTEATLHEIEKFFGELGSGILGLPISGSSSVVSGNGSAEAGLMDLIIEVRKEIRKQKMWVLSDKIRDAIKALGIVLEDTKDGTTWKKA